MKHICIPGWPSIQTEDIPDTAIHMAEMEYLIVNSNTESGDSLSYSADHNLNPIFYI